MNMAVAKDPNTTQSTELAEEPRATIACPGFGVVLTRGG